MLEHTVSFRKTYLRHLLFIGLTPRYKVTCQGVITVTKVNGIDCQPDVDLSCTVKLDSDMLVRNLLPLQVPYTS